jgi:general stress protein 26
MSESRELTGLAGMKKIGELVADIRFAMLTTVAPDGTLDSRPMATQKAEFDGVIWFLTAAASRKNEEIAENANVSLIYADPGNASYITVKGHARVLDDRSKVRELWNAMYRAWFPGGEDDPNIRVLRVDVSEAEYWEANDSKIIRGIKYLAAAATKGAVDVGEHGTVNVAK